MRNVARTSFLLLDAAFLVIAVLFPVRAAVGAPRSEAAVGSNRSSESGQGEISDCGKPKVTFSASPTQLRYRKLGDKVLAFDSSTLSWSTSDAKLVMVNGTRVQSAGKQVVRPEPTDTSEIPEGQAFRNVDYNRSYTLKASNACGETSRTISLHIVGSVEPIPTVTLQSIFFPTKYPDVSNPDVGLLKSQKDALDAYSSAFLKYLSYVPDAYLELSGTRDECGAEQDDNELSRRRAQMVRKRFVENGVPADKVRIVRVGLQLDQGMVKQLESENPNRAAKFRDELFSAYNRRVDIVLRPSGTEGKRYYPNNADDADLLWRRAKPSLSTLKADE